MPERSRTHYSFLNVTTGIGGYILSTVLGFVHRYVFVKTLSPDYLGLRGLFGNIFTMLSLAELGIGTAIVYALYKPLAEHNEEQIAALVQFYGKCYRCIGLFIGVIGLCLMPFLRFIIKTPPNIKENLYLLYILSLSSTVASYLWGYRSTILTAAQKHYIVQGISYIQEFLTVVVNITVLLLTHDYFLHAVTNLLGALCGIWAINYYAFKEFNFIRTKKQCAIEPDTKKTLTKNIRDLVVLKISEVFVYGIDNISITYFSGLISTGLTSNYSLLVGFAGALPRILFYNLNASIGNFNAIESKERQKKLFFTLNLANFWIFGWVAIGIFFCSSDLVQLVFGEEFVLSSSIPLAMAINYYLVMMTNTPRTFLTTQGIFHPLRYLNVSTAILNIAFSVWFGMMWGVFGVLIATALARTLTSAWFIPYAMFRYCFNERPWHYFRIFSGYLVIILFTGGICYLICQSMHFSLWLNTLLKMTVCTLMPNIVLWMIYHNAEQYAYLKEKINIVLHKLVREKS